MPIWDEVALTDARVYVGDVHGQYRVTTTGIGSGARREAWVGRSHGHQGCSRLRYHCTSLMALDVGLHFTVLRSTERLQPMTFIRCKLVLASNQC